MNARRPLNRDASTGASHPWVQVRKPKHPMPAQEAGRLRAQGPLNGGGANASPTTRADRNRQIVAFYRRGFSLRETGKQFSMSLEMVRQVLLKLAPDAIRPPYDTHSNSTGKTSSQRRAHSSTVRET